MRIAQVTPYFYPQLGGITTFVDNLTIGLRERGHEVDIKAEPTDLKGYDVIHAHAHRQMVPKTPNGAKVVFTVHTVPDDLSFMRKRIFGRALSRCDAVTHHTHFSRNATLPLARGSYHVVIPPGVRVSEKEYNGRVDWFDYLKTGRKVRVMEMECTRPILTTIVPFCHKPKVEGLVCLGKMVENMRTLHDQGKWKEKPTLIVMGGGPLLKEVESKFDGSGVRFLGNTPNVFPYLRACDLYVQLSFKDNINLSVLEAMTVGKPVVAYAAGGLPEYWPWVADDLTTFEKMLQFYCQHDEGRENLAELAKALVDETLNYEKMVRRYESLYLVDR